jgi:hypothetical protein
MPQKKIVLEMLEALGSSSSSNGYERNSKGYFYSLYKLCDLEMKGDEVIGQHPMTVGGRWGIDRIPVLTLYC